MPSACARARSITQAFAPLSRRNVNGPDPLIVTGKKTRFPFRSTGKLAMGSADESDGEAEAWVGVGLSAAMQSGRNDDPIFIHDQGGTAHLWGCHDRWWRYLCITARPRRGCDAAS